MDDTPYTTLRRLLDATPGAIGQLQEAHKASKEGRHQAALVMVAITADAVHAAHPDTLDDDDTLTLNRELRRLFLE